MKQQFLFLMTAVMLGSSLTYAEADIRSTEGPGGRSITAFDRVGQRQLGGYFDTEWNSLENGTQTFKAHRFVFEASSQVHEKILVNSEIEFEYGGYLVDENTQLANKVTNGELKLEQAWVYYELSDHTYFRGGIVVVPFGLVNVLHDSDVRDTTNRPIFAKYIVPSTWVDTGVGVHGVADINDIELNYSAYVINGLGSDITSSKGIRNARPNFKSDNNQASSLAGRIGISPALSFEAGLSAYTGKYSDNNEKGLSLLGLDLSYRKGPYEIISEWAQANIDDVNNMDGYYVEGRYHFFPKFFKKMFFAKDFAHPTFTLFGRYSAVDLDKNINGTDDKAQLTLGMNFRPVETVVFKFEGELNYEDGNKTGTSGLVSSVAVGF